MKKKITYMMLGIVTLIMILTISGCQTNSEGTLRETTTSSNCLDKDEDILSELM